MENNHDEVMEIQPTVVGEADAVTEVETPEPVENQSMPSMQELQSLMHTVKEMLSYQESIWQQTQSEFNVNSNQMRIIIDYNEANRIVPEGIDLDDPSTYPEDFDFVNGINNISEEKLIEIFGEDAEIFGVDQAQTVDRVKWAAQAFYNYMRALFDFNNLSKQYSQIIEDREKLSIEQLKAAIEQETDAEKKASMEKQLYDHFYFKYLDFLKEAVDEKNMGHIVNTFNDARKIQYIIERTRNELSRLKISEKFILEIAQFEKLYLEEKYHTQSNLLLMYFMNLIVFNDVDNKSETTKRKVLAMIVGLDKFIRKDLSDDVANILLQNIMTLEDQFLGKITSNVFNI
jgi:hypothetical protein